MQVSFSLPPKQTAQTSPPAACQLWYTSFRWGLSPHTTYIPAPASQRKSIEGEEINASNRVYKHLLLLIRSTGLIVLVKIAAASRSSTGVLLSGECLLERIYQIRCSDLVSTL